ncbi:MAG: translation initiation factor IF-2 [Endomicrobium sp.]|jgi:translation initiation factor IF-2|nr:translation initiation factor IF-2 [Endomicrobium sp.]
MPIKQKNNEEKVIKKKAVSGTSKSKNISVKKSVKKSTTAPSKKATKIKVSVKKTKPKANEIKSNTTVKTTKTRTVKSAAGEKKKTSRKTVPHEKITVHETLKKKDHKVVEEKLDKIHGPAVKHNTHEYIRENNSIAGSKKAETRNNDMQNKDEYKTDTYSGIEKAAYGNNVQKNKTKEDASKKEEAKYKAVILINELITVRELADKMRLRSGEVLKKLMSLGSLATINQRLDQDTATLLANEFGYDVKMESIYCEEEIESFNNEENSVKLKPRSPVVTIMGHVDHGKTSLLDAIRNSNIVSGEHGGITQHIGAYKVQVSDGRYITFLDTPGHEAFTAMRSRGSQITDIAVLVVSAVDGVMPQTVESINHAKAANVPIIVAVNKIDMPAADSQKIRQELSNYGLVPEEWGGDTIMVDISAKQKTNIDLLLEMILLKSEMMELKANPDKNAEGIVIEAKLDSKRGAVATLLIQSGTLRIGDNIVVGTTYGKVRALADERGKRLTFAEPSTPVSILGINKPPQAGDKFVVVKHESQARQIAQSRSEKVKEASLKPVYHLSLADISTGKAKNLRIILKADVQGSLGALSDALCRLSTSEISLDIIHSGAGAITESDIALAVASNALILGFNLRPSGTIEKLAEKEKVSINVYRIIYDLIADVKAAMEGLLDPDMKEKITGTALVKRIFKLSSFGTVSGCFVTDGKIQRGAKVRLLRDSVIVFEGNISSLKRFKDDVKEVEKGYECGIVLENFSDIKPEDVIESFITEKIARKLED